MGSMGKALEAFLLTTPSLLSENIQNALFQFQCYWTETYLKSWHVVAVPETIYERRNGHQPSIYLKATNPTQFLMEFENLVKSSFFLKLSNNF